MTTSLLRDAFAHHVWATEQLIDACTTLTPEQLGTTAPGTFGSIIDTLRHLVGADSWYLSFFSEEASPPTDEPSLAELRSVIAGNGRAWEQVLAGEIDPDQDIVDRDADGEYHAPVGVRLAQAVHHGTDHRSQVCSALTELGVVPPDIDVWAYARAVGREWTVPAAATP